MDAYEFSTQVTKTGYVVIPTEYIDQIPQGTDVRVMILVNKPKITTNGQNGHHDEFGSLEALITEIKSNPSKPENIHPALDWQVSDHANRKLKSFRAHDRQPLKVHFHLHLSDNQTKNRFSARYFLREILQ